MLKRSEFLSVLETATKHVRMYKQSQFLSAAVEALQRGGVKQVREGSGLENPIVEAVVIYSIGITGFFGLRTAEEKAWEYYVEAERKAEEDEFLPTRVVGNL